MVILAAIVFGLLFGSFFNVLIYRLPRKQDFVWKRSHCPQCDEVIWWWMNIPLISFTYLRAKCAFCKHKISWQYPLVELLTMVMSVHLALKILPSSLLSDEWSFSVIFNFLFYFFVFGLLLCHFVIDWQWNLLLDKINIVLAILILAFVCFHHPWQHWVWGGGLGFGLTYAVTWGFYFYSGKIGLGGGDIKLFGILGMYLGPLGILNNLMMSCAFGIILFLYFLVTRKQKADQPIPFGPAIILAAVLQIFFPSLSALVELY